MSRYTTAKDAGPLEPFNDRTRLRHAVSEALRARAKQHRRGSIDMLFLEAADGDQLLAVALASELKAALLDET